MTSGREAVQPEGGIITAAATDHLERGCVVVEDDAVLVLPQLPAAQQDEGGSGAGREPRPTAIDEDGLDGAVSAEGGPQPSAKIAGQRGTR